MKNIILLADNNPFIVDIREQELQRLTAHPSGYIIVHAVRLPELIKLIDQHRDNIAVALIDWRFGIDDATGKHVTSEKAIHHFVQHVPETPLLILSGDSSLISDESGFKGLSANELGGSKSGNERTPAVKLAWVKTLKSLLAKTFGSYKSSNEEANMANMEWVKVLPKMIHENLLMNEVNNALLKVIIKSDSFDQPNQREQPKTPAPQSNPARQPDPKRAQFG